MNEERIITKSIFWLMQVYRVRVHNCSTHGTCADCLNVRDPYCGWCDTQRRWD